jgi:hypothetical protein
VRSIVKDKDIPSSSTIFRWLLDEDKKDFWDDKARNIQAGYSPLNEFLGTYSEDTLWG